MYFDPHCAFLPNISALNPGKRIDFVAARYTHHNLAIRQASAVQLTIDYVKTFADYVYALARLCIASKRSCIMQSALHLWLHACQSTHADMTPP